MAPQPLSIDLCPPPLPGQLRGEVRSSSNATIPCRVDHPSASRSSVSFVLLEVGKHLLYLCWNDLPLLGSPFLGMKAAMVKAAVFVYCFMK